MPSVLDRLDSMYPDKAPAKEAATCERISAPRAGTGDPEIQAMNAEAPLLDLIRADTGEQGREAGDRVDFDVCPVCGHRDCFRFYPSTNTWSCFGESNRSPYKGGSYTEYQISAHGMDATEAVKALREATGHPYEGYDAPLHLERADAPTGPTEGANAPKLLLPPWESVRAVDPPKRAPVLVEGVLRRGHVALLAGKAKTGKSWAAIQLAVAVATGGSWMGFPCAKGRVLYIDPEIDRPSLDQRFAKVCRALGEDAAEVEARVVKWCLRGVTTAKGEPPFIDDVAHDVAARCSRGDFDLVVVDSCSCFLRGDENSSVDVHRFFAQVHRIVAATGAATFAVHHYGKGDAGDRSSIDRSRGSSVWGDSPDAPLSLTEILPKEGKPSDYLADRERALVLEDSGLREFAGIEPVHLVYRYPVHRLDEDGITKDWAPRASTARGGRKTAEGNRKKSEERRDRCIIALLAHMYAEGVGEEGIAANDAAEACTAALGETVKAPTLKKYVDESDALDVWQKSPRRWLVVPRAVPRRTEQERIPD